MLSLVDTGSNASSHNNANRWCIDIPARMGPTSFAFALSWPKQLRLGANANELGFTLARHAGYPCTNN